MSTPAFKYPKPTRTGSWASWYFPSSLFNTQQLTIYSFLGTSHQGLLHWEIWNFTPAIQESITSREYFENCIRTLKKEFEQGRLWTIDYDCPKDDDLFLFTKNGEISPIPRHFSVFNEPRVILVDAFPTDENLLREIPYVP